MKDTQYYLALNYRKVVSKDEDGIFIVEIPDLPGCMADGNTVDEAFHNLTEAMEVWIASRLEAGENVPEPRDVDAYSGKFVVRLPKQLHQALAEQAESEECSLNQHIVALLSEAIGRNKEAKLNVGVEKSLSVIKEAVQRIERAVETPYFRTLEDSTWDLAQIFTGVPQLVQRSQQATTIPFDINTEWASAGQQRPQGFPSRA